MATYTERLEYKIEIQPNKLIQLRTGTIVERDGVEIGRSYNRTVYEPGTSTAEAPNEVTAIANVLWTPAVVSAYQVLLEEDSDPDPTPPSGDPIDLF